MQLLLNRFRGALRGATIGEAVSAANDRFTWQQVQSGEWLSTQQNWKQSRLLIAAVEHTIAQALNQPIDRPPIPDTQYPTRRDARSRVSTQPPTPDTRHPTPDPQSPTPLDWLPIALFFHENPMLLRQQIDRITEQLDAIEQACILALSEAIALTLREELLIDQLLPRLSELTAPVSPIVSNQLVQVQAWLESDASLTMVTRSPNLPPALDRLSLALYGWLSVPQDFNLALLRMQRSPAAIWLGALAGAHHGASGMAIDWWQPFRPSATHQAWQTEILEPIDRLADRLLAVWAGADAIAPPSIDQVGIAAAGLIRPR